MNGPDFCDQARARFEPRPFDPDPEAPVRYTSPPRRGVFTGFWGRTAQAIIAASAVVIALYLIGM